MPPKRHASVPSSSRSASATAGHRVRRRRARDDRGRTRGRRTAGTALGGGRERGDRGRVGAVGLVPGGDRGARRLRPDDPVFTAAQAEGALLSIAEAAGLEAPQTEP